MDNWDLNESFDKMGSAYFQSYDETNNIALDISGYLILRHDMILYNGLSLNNTLAILFVSSKLLTYDELNLSNVVSNAQLFILYIFR